MMINNHELYSRCTFDMPPRYQHHKEVCWLQGVIIRSHWKPLECRLWGELLSRRSNLQPGSSQSFWPRWFVLMKEITWMFGLLAPLDLCACTHALYTCEHVNIHLRAHIHILGFMCAYWQTIFRTCLPTPLVYFTCLWTYEALFPFHKNTHRQGQCSHAPAHNKTNAVGAQVWACRHMRYSRADIYKCAWM